MRVATPPKPGQGKKKNEVEKMQFFYTEKKKKKSEKGLYYLSSTSAPVANPIENNVDNG